MSWVTRQVSQYFFIIKLRHAHDTEVYSSMDVLVILNLGQRINFGQMHVQIILVITASIVDVVALSRDAADKCTNRR